MTSAHPRGDVRIFLKQCRSLAAAGHEVTLVVADGLPDEVRDGVRIVSVPRRAGRMGRMTKATRDICARAVALGADICHLHDPELLVIAKELQRAGAKVIFDAHEDLPKQILSKEYLWAPIRGIVAFGVEKYELRVCHELDAIVGATPAIRNKFRAINPRSLSVSNFPIRGELAFNLRQNQKRRQVCYVGGISEIRGVKELVAGMEQVRSGARLVIAGECTPNDLRAALTVLGGWRSVDELGWVDRAAVRELLGNSIAGIVTFLPVPNHVEAQPNKMFEYMSASLPVIGSNFPLWREIIEGNDCGICVDPQDPQAIARAIDWLVEHPEEAERMGRNGRRAVEERYNWQHEEAKLLALYEELAA